MAKVAPPEELDIIVQLAEMTNDRLRQERGELLFLPKEDWVKGLHEYVLAPFAYRNPEGSRFSDGTYGVYYAGKDLHTAVEEIKYHRALFLARTQEPAMQLPMRILTADLSGDLHDIRGSRKKFSGFYNKSNYLAAQSLGRALSAERSHGIVYNSVRHNGGECVAVFRPQVLNRCCVNGHMIFEWDGTKINKVYELREYL